MTTQADFRQQLEILVNRFAANLDEYLAPGYTEAQARSQFIDPFFAALGWDMLDEAGLGPLRCEVWVEKGETPGRPDYNFRIAGRTRFFAEAKPPHARLSSAAIMQAKRYAWNTQDVYFVALTDFEEFRLYDASLKPDPAHPDLGLIFAYRYDEYLSDKALADLWLLSRDAVAAGSLDKLLKQDAATRRLRVPVDQAFLADLSTWREQLAKDCYKHTPDLDVPALNEAVQVLLDRLIFVRIAEDRRVIEAGALRKLIEQWSQGKQRSLRAMLNRLFEQINLDLDGEVFKSNAALDSATFDDALIAKIARALYDGPYDFAVIGVELLGSIYERYLGKTIRVTPKRAIIEDKPEVRKAGGVYYTPKYIVDYIVENTVGKLIAGKTPAQIAGERTGSPLRILDPACGSGSFLLGAYQKLIDYHTAYYIAHPEEARRGGLFPYLVEEADGRKHLSIEKKAEILANNIFGVDLDPQAVEITMMSLYIKALEGETMLPRKRGLLPSLKGNIKCGNSLVEEDYFNCQLLPDQDEMRQIRPMSWRREFAQIMQAGGFDCVIGNPPYVRGRSLPPQIKQYLVKAYQTFMPNSDIYVAFLERALSLLKPDGLLGVIIPRPYLTESYAADSRRHFLTQARILTLADLKGVKVFSATVTNLIFIVQRCPPVDNAISILDWKSGQVSELPQDHPLTWPDASIRPELDAPTLAIINKAQMVSLPLGDICYVSYSVAAHSEVENKTKDAYIFDRRKNKKCVPFIEAREISRYHIGYQGRWLQYDPKIVRRPGLPELFAAEKIMVRDVVGDRGLICAFDNTGLYADYSVVCLTLNSNLQNVASRKLEWTPAEIELSRPYSLLYLLGIMNSTLLNFIFRKSIGGGLHVYPDNLRQLPIRRIDFTNPADIARHERMVTLVERMLEYHQRLAAAQSQHDQDMYRRLVASTDEQIDALVYELYGLTEADIALIEQ